MFKAGDKVKVKKLKDCKGDKFYLDDYDYKNLYGKILTVLGVGKYERKDAIQINHVPYCSWWNINHFVKIKQ